MSLKDSNNNVKPSLMSPSTQYCHNSKAPPLAPDCNKSLSNQVPICSGCARPIIDQYLHNILDKYWHIQCLRCTDCDKQLSGRCYEREGQLFCAVDYKRRVCTKCSLCLNIILPSELVRHSRDSSVFHLKCFFCVICHKQLSTGDEYCLLENFRPVCKEDFQNIFKDLSEIGSHNCKSSAIKLESELIKEEIQINCQKEGSNSQINVIKDVEPFKADQFSQPSSGPSGLLKNTSKFSFSDIPNFKQQSLPTANIPCQDIQKPRSSNSDPENRFMEQHPNIVVEDSRLCDIIRSGSEHPQMENQLLTPEQSDKLPSRQQSNYDKEHELCSLEDDLKSSFSAASSPESNIKEEEQDPNDGNVSDQTFQDDQQSICHTESREGAQSGNSGTKRRGPRTTIKAKQLDTLKAAFAATPKPTRHVREQLAQDTGLTMRVIQVWFQNRRSKERRMKQLSAMGARRPFFRNARRMRSLSRGFGPDDMGGDGGQMMNNAPYHGYFGENPEFCNAIAALGGSFQPSNNYPLGHPSIHREFFLSNANHNLQPPFITLNQPTSLQNSIQLPSSEGNQSILVSGQLENNFNSNDHFNPTNCASPEVQFSQPNFSSMSPHNLLPGPGYLCGPQITSTGISRPQSIQNLSSLNFVQAPMVGMESW